MDLKNITLLEFMKLLPADYEVIFHYVFQYEDHHYEIDNEYSYEGFANEYEDCMRGYDFQFDFVMEEFYSIDIDVLRKECKMVYVVWSTGAYECQDRLEDLDESRLELVYKLPAWRGVNYKKGEQIVFRHQGEVKAGIIDFVDKHGTFIQLIEPSYDIWCEDQNGERCLYKHVPQHDVRHRWWLWSFD